MRSKARWWPAILVAAAFGGPAKAEMPRAKNPPRVGLDANRMRFTKVAGGDWDDRTQKVQLEVTVENLDFNRPVSGLTLHYWALAESLVDKKAFLVIDRGEFAVDLTNKPDGREITQKGALVTLKWDDTGAIFGERYKGYVLVLTNAQNEAVAVKANQPGWQRGFEGAFQLKRGAWCGLELQPAKDPSEAGR
jgi:hypothetical protein